jgi:hypothetical protein
MVGWDTVTDICRDKGRFSGEPSFASIGLMRFYGGLQADCRPRSNFADHTF